MMQLEVECLPLVFGFSIGTVIFILNRLLVRQTSKKLAKLNEAVPAEEPEPASPASPGLEPAPEPGLEGEAAAEEGGAGGRRRPAKARTLAILALALVMAAALLAAYSLGPASELTPAEPPAEVPPLPPAPRMEVEQPPSAQHPEPVAAVDAAPMPAKPPAAAAEAPVAAAEKAEQLPSAQRPEPVPSVDAAPAAAEPPAAAAEPPAAAAEEVPRAAEEQPQEERSLPESADLEDSEDLSQAITLNLTRQQMAFTMVGNTVHYKSAYWGTISVGQPAESFKVVFDTGSGHLILPSAYCHAETCRVHKRYRRSKSTSAKDINYDGAIVQKGDPRDQITISFGTGEVTGVFVEDTFCLHASQGPGAGGATSLEGCMPLRTIMATHMSEDPFKTFHFDGVLGLGLPGLSQAPEFNFAHMIAGSLRQRGSPRPNVFSVFLAEHQGETSEITLGGWVRRRMESELHWNPVLEPEHGHWMLAIKSVRIDDEVLSYCDEGCHAVVDTGTSLLAVPRPAFPEIFELLRHEADPELECHGHGPKFHIELEGFTVTLDPHDYSKLESSLPNAKPRTPAVTPALVPSFASTEEPAPEICKPMLMSMSLGPPVGPKVFVLGEPALRKYYTVYDSQEPQPRIGFALAAHVPPEVRQLKEGSL